MQHSNISGMVQNPIPVWHIERGFITHEVGVDRFERIVSFLEEADHLMVYGPIRYANFWENNRTGLLWDLFMSSEEIQQGLVKPGFRF